MLYRILVAILFKLQFINFSNNRKKLNKIELTKCFNIAESKSIIISEFKVS
jgi:hypothetical protein